MLGIKSVSFSTTNLTYLTYLTYIDIYTHAHIHAHAHIKFFREKVGYVGYVRFLIDL